MSEIRKWLVSAFAAALLAAAPLPAQQEHTATGIVLRVDQAKHTMVVSCDEIAGYMSAMEMSFSVRRGAELTSIQPGASVRFTMVTKDHVVYANHLRMSIAANLESEPMQAGALGTLQGALHPETAQQVVAQGEHVPDFQLIDQTGSEVRLSSFAGKVVVLTFGYSRCPNPNYCVRLSNNLARVRDRFRTGGRNDLVLLTIDIDPEHDQGEALREYAAVWKANPANWHFLTGPLLKIKQVAAMFGMNFWRNEGFLTHSLHTVIIDRSQALSANLEGNQFSPRQLGDLIQTIVDRPH
jgi:protein SCO1/2